MFRAKSCSSSGGKNCIKTVSGIVTLCKWPSGALDGHLQRVTIPDAVLIQFDLLMMSMKLLETCRGLNSNKMQHFFGKPVLPVGRL